VSTNIGQALDSTSFNSSFPLFRGLLLSAVFLASWAGSSFLIGTLLPFPNVPNVGAKWRYFDDHKDRIDTVFIGSSRMVSQIIPTEFDAETAALGAPTHSFNLACTGMWPPESCFFLRQILKLRPLHLKWVVIDLMNVNSRIYGGNGGAQRAEYWHDGHGTLMAWRDILDSTKTPQEKATHLWTHGCIFVTRLANPGRAVEWLATRMHLSNAERPPDWVQTAGFEPNSKDPLPADAVQQFVETVAELKKGLSKQRMRPVFYDAVKEMAAEVRRAGAEPVFVLAPTMSVKENWGGLPPGVTLLAFNDPTQYPLLFDPDLHFNAWHLNERGAVPYSHLLARRFTEWRQSKPEAR
jgi:hypothetical protein